MTGDNPSRAGIAPDVLCRKCGKSVDAASTFCPHCGTRQAEGQAWYYHPVWILVLAFVALGPIALFFVWKSRMMSRAGKVFMAVLILAYTGYCTYFLYKITAFELKFLSDFGDVTRQLRPR